MKWLKMYTKKLALQLDESILPGNESLLHGAKCICYLFTVAFITNIWLQKPSVIVYISNYIKRALLDQHTKQQVPVSCFHSLAPGIQR